MHTPISCVLIDVGGTLWPSGWLASAVASEIRITQLCRALPELTPDLGRTLYQQLHTAARAARLNDPLLQDTDAIIRKAVQCVGLAADAIDPRAMRKAVRVSPVGHLALFPGAPELLQSIKKLDLGCVAVSNTAWRDSDDYRNDFADMGIAEFFDTIISSVDVGFRKPHRAMFEAALAAAHCPAQQCIMIGNSEEKDIQPALALGMRTIRVAIENTKPAASQAHVVVDSLYQAAAVLHDWVAKDGQGE